VSDVRSVAEGFSDTATEQYPNSLNESYTLLLH
jgi:hypothetical protein